MDREVPAEVERFGELALDACWEVYRHFGPGMYEIDFVVGDCVGLEAKALDFLNPVYERQLVSYLKLGGWPLGLLVNFNSTWFRSGIKRKVNTR